MPRTGNPDYVVDADRGSGSTAAKRARLVDAEAYSDRVGTREGLRQLDAMTEQMPGLNRLQRDRERIMPRGTTADLGHARMERKLPGAADVRQPLSARQRNARSKARLETARAIPLAQLRAQRDLVTRPDRWQATNDALSEQTGDVQALPAADQERVRRIDRAIQAYERRNDRGHVLYANVQMPFYINDGNLHGFMTNNFEPGRRISFDRYTVATHQLHETAGQVHDPRGRVVTFEMQTRRGAYLGHSDKVDSTAHLLPRGMEFEVADVHQASYRTPEGRTKTRLVVQLRDVTPGP
ncbi:MULTISPECIES: hypothetical protein [Cellulosimicrobium]|uniref:hypothetical protein n=1 Tax=Cellulosimicrobium TaxID=157920 RepID=UPI003430E22C